MTDVTDNFNRADGALGSNWSISHDGVSTPPTISGNKIIGNSSGNWIPAYWSNSVNTFADDQFSQATVVSGSTGVVVRHGVTGVSQFYALLASGGQFFIFRYDSGFALLNSASFPSNPGDVLRLEVAGTTLTAKSNGATIVTATDTTFSSGQPGIVPLSTTDSMDDWSGGPIVVLDQTITPSSLYSDTDSVNVLTAAAFNTLIVGLVASDEIFSAPAVSAIAAVLPALFADSDLIPAPTASVAAITEAILSAGLFSDTDALYAPNVANVLQFLRAALLADRDQFYAQQLIGGIPVRMPTGVLSGSVGRRPTLTGTVGQRSALTGSLRH